MPIGEFELIKKYFQREELFPQLSGISGIGDDCALIDVPVGMQLAQSLDTLVEGVHFPFNCDPVLVGTRSLAVNLSDLAAMGASPHSFMLGLTLPESNENWLKGFSDGLSALAQDVNIALIGGDVTRGPLTVSIQVQGLITKGKALKRGGASVGDHVYVSGNLGDAAGALKFALGGQRPSTAANNDIHQLLKRYYMPSPRLDLSLWLRDHGVTSAIDISDGLLGDLKHILVASDKGAVLNLNGIPCSDALISIYGVKQARWYAMMGGDDYELCFTWPEDKICALPDSLGCKVSCIGRITKEQRLTDSDSGTEINLASYTHF